MKKIINGFLVGGCAWWILSNASNIFLLTQSQPIEESREFIIISIGLIVGLGVSICALVRLIVEIVKEEWERN